MTNNNEPDIEQVKAEAWEYINLRYEYPESSLADFIDILNHLEQNGYKIVRVDA